ncbi:TetR/AcrR family transcriptional regulator [Sporichthya sp.]|uniref:TetR/AcrR family transcriptional regulator n=1 Tax=Sporichthya sp. TaxID=65475 RepID=UPI0017E2F6F2|nr:TetR/AcrR family transcriptional regulator [Sporichthya sp.]MBA3741546.1 TetR/AcrR family transcriptional regulator [Sporichthya sp.]
MTSAEVAPKRRRLSAEDRRAQIISVAREVFIEFGHSAALMRVVAQRANIAEPFLYRHFHSKEDLYQAAVLDPLDEFVDGITAEIHELAQRSDIPRAQILEHFHQLFLSQMAELAPLIVATLYSDSQDGADLYNRVLLPRVREVSGEIIADISGRDTSTFDLDVLTKALIGVYFGLAVENAIVGGVWDSRRLGHELATLFANGITPDRKRRSAEMAAGSAIPIEPFTLELAPSLELATRPRVPREERRELVHVAAREVFVEVGQRRARTKDIAERAGITEAFMYRIVDSKEQLYRDSVVVPFAEGVAEFADRVKVLSAITTGVAFVQAFNELSLRFFAVYGQIGGLTLLSEPVEGRQVFNDVLRAPLAQLEKALGKGSGIDPDTVDLQVARRAILGAQCVIALDGNGAVDPQREKELARGLTVLFTGGIR